MCTLYLCTYHVQTVTSMYCIKTRVHNPFQVFELPPMHCHFCLNPDWSLCRWQSKTLSRLTTIFLRHAKHEGNLPEQPDAPPQYLANRRSLNLKQHEDCLFSRNCYIRIVLRMTICHFRNGFLKKTPIEKIIDQSKINYFNIIRNHVFTKRHLTW